jgi:hypothetical protein
MITGHECLAAFFINLALSTLLDLLAPLDHEGLQDGS